MDVINCKCEQFSLYSYIKEFTRNRVAAARLSSVNRDWSNSNDGSGAVSGHWRDKIECLLPA